MDDIQIVIYIVFVLFALVSRFLKKKKEEAPKTTTDNRRKQPSAGKKQMSFEELLREFTEGPSQEVVEQKIEETDYDEVKYHDDEEIQKIYNKSVAETKKYNSKFDAEEHDERHSGNFSHFKGYSEEDVDEEDNEYAEMLHDGESAKRAIILAEILNRKY